MLVQRAQQYSGDLVRYLAPAVSGRIHEYVCSMLPVSRLCAVAS